MDLDKLLENREILLYWDTPRHGVNVKGTVETINMQSSVTVQDAIDIRRWELQERQFGQKTKPNLIDKELLDDFIIVYSAYTK